MDNTYTTLRSRLIAILASNADRPEHTLDDIMELFITVKREAVAEYYKEYNKKHPEKRLEAAKRYRIKHKEMLKIKRRRYGKVTNTNNLAQQPATTAASTK